MRKLEFAVNLLFLLPAFAALAIVVMCACLSTHPLNIILICGCYAAGIGSLLWAKLSLFRQGIWVSFGPAQMDAERRQSYWSGYVLLVIGAVLQALVILVQI